MRIRAALFDVFGTLLDVYSVTRRAEGNRSRAMARASRSRGATSRSSTPGCARCPADVPFSQVMREALEFALDLLGLSSSAANVSDMLDEYKRLTLFPDVVPAFEALLEGGVELGVLSNGDPEMLEAALVSAGLHRHLDLALSADEVGAFKTDATGVRALGRAPKLPAREILFVEQRLGRHRRGLVRLHDLWINRFGLPLERLGVPPTRIGAVRRRCSTFFSRTSHDTPRSSEHEPAARHADQRARSSPSFEPILTLPTRSRWSPSCTARSKRRRQELLAARSSAPSAHRCRRDARLPARDRRTSATATGRSRRCRRRCSAAASRSPARWSQDDHQRLQLRRRLPT